jgi:hypothetical protein
VLVPADVYYEAEVNIRTGKQEHAEQMATQTKEIELKTHMERNSEFRNPLRLILYSNGNIAFSKDNAETFVYLYKDQVRRLMQILNRQNRLLKASS